MKKFCLVLFTILLLCSGYLFAQEPGLVLFSKTYENYAWGHQYNGYFIDSDGNLNKFDYAACKASPIDRIAGKKVTSNAELRNQFSTGLKFVKKVNLQKLKEMKELIVQVAVASHSKPINRGVDMGTYRWTAYSWDETGKTFKPVFLKEDGDFFSQSTATDAAKIVDWLDTIRK